MQIPKIIFYTHIPKTAGTALRDVICNIYPDIYFLWLDKNHTTERGIIDDLSTLILGGFPIFVGGHFTIKFVDKVLDAIKIPIVDVLVCSVIRDPFDRFCSYYEYIHNMPGHELQKETKNDLRLEITQTTPFLIKHSAEQCAYISGSNNFTAVAGALKTYPLILVSIDNIQSLVEILFLLSGRKDMITSHKHFYDERSDLLFYRANHRNDEYPYKIKYSDVLFLSNSAFREDLKLWSLIAQSCGIFFSPIARSKYQNSLREYIDPNQAKSADCSYGDFFADMMSNIEHYQNFSSLKNEMSFLKEDRYLRYQQNLILTNRIKELEFICKQNSSASITKIIKQLKFKSLRKFLNIRYFIIRTAYNLSKHLFPGSYDNEHK